ncbi:hypothetical protein BGW41_002934 [Actinomortierella wolfii]|nr:hypothetical protein BGW41_002934 [Actinomortierella wolfii]
MAPTTLSVSPLVMGAMMVLLVAPKRVEAGIGKGIGSALVNSGLSIGAIIGIVVGIIVLCVIIAYIKHACRSNPHTTVSEGTVTAVPQPMPVPVPMSQPTGHTYPPMSPQPAPAPSPINTLSSPYLGTDAARPVTVDEYNQVYANLGMTNGSTVNTNATATTPNSPINVNLTAAPTIYPSPAMTHVGTIGSPPSTAASPYMSSSTPGSISVVISPSPNTPGNANANASSTQLPSLQPAPVNSYPPLPPAPTLSAAYTPSSSYVYPPYPVMDTSLPTATSSGSFIPADLQTQTQTSTTTAPTRVPTVQYTG